MSSKIDEPSMISYQHTQRLLSHEKSISYKIYTYSSEKQTSLTISYHSIIIGDRINIEIKDAIGIIRDKQEEVQEDKEMRGYTIYSFPKRKKFMRKQKRQIQQVKFKVKPSPEWQQIQQQIIQLITNRRSDEPKKLLICFNPNAGANSESHLLKINKFISKTNLQSEIFTTEHRNHCLQYLKSINTKQYCGVAIVSGDGLMHQFVNSFCTLPVTHVPAGSGNAFSKTQTQIAGEQCRDQQTIFLVLKNNPKQFKLVKYQLQKIEEPIYSFLSLEWAFIADIDMNSQFLRCLGGLRFEIYAAWRCLAMKRYRGRIVYSTTKNCLPPLTTQIDQNTNSQGYKIITNNFLHAIFCTIPYISDKYRIAPLAKVQNRSIDMQLLTEQQGRMQLIKYLLNSDSGSHFNQPQQKPSEGFRFDYEKIQSFRLQPLDPREMGIFGIDGESYQAQKIQGSLSNKTFKAFV